MSSLPHSSPFPLSETQLFCHYYFILSSLFSIPFLVFFFTLYTFLLSFQRVFSLPTLCHLFPSHLPPTVLTNWVLIPPFIVFLVLSIVYFGPSIHCNLLGVVYAMPCHAMPCHVMSCHAIPYHAMSYIHILNGSHLILFVLHTNESSYLPISIE